MTEHFEDETVKNDSYFGVTSLRGRSDNNVSDSYTVDFLKTCQVLTTNHFNVPSGVRYLLNRREGQ